MSEKRILIIDDEPLIGSALSDFLAECGYDTSTADDGEQGLAAKTSGSGSIGPSNRPGYPRRGGTP